VVSVARAASLAQVGSGGGGAGTCSCVCIIVVAVGAIVNASAIAGVSTIL